MERRTFTIALIILALSMAAQAEDGTQKDPEPKSTPKWSEQSKSVQRLFEQQAPNWVKIGDKLWCVEVMKEAQRRGKTSQGAAYLAENAPWFYEPISETKIRSTAELYKQLKLDGMRLIRGGVTDSNNDGLLVYAVDENRKSFMAFIPYSGPKIKESTQVTMLLEPTGEEYFFKDKNLKTSGKKYQSFSEVNEIDKADPVSADQLFDYFALHGITTFPVWRPKLNKTRDGFDWIIYPRQIR
jgi:hypothetical protein